MKCNHALTDANNPTGKSWKHNCALCEIDRLRLEVTTLNECLRKKNIALDAMSWVWCDGGCETGVHRHIPKELTLEMVEAAELNTQRMRRALTNSEFKKIWAEMSDGERLAWFAARDAREINDEK